MGFDVPHCRSLLLHALLVFLISHGTTLAMKSARRMHVHDAHDDPSSHIDSIFFDMKDLEVGKIIPLYFPKKASPIQFLSRHKVDSIPFSSKQLPYLLNFFSIARGSKEAQEMENTLRSCETPAVKGETKFCATSWESMLDFVGHIFEMGQDFNFLTSAVHSSPYSEGISSFQNYTVLKTPEEVLASKMVSCHTMAYAYTVLHCHTQDGPKAFKAYKVLLGGENGDIFDGLVGCHLDTTRWDPNYAAFRLIGSKPGNHVCHIFPPHANLLWVQMPKTSI